MGIDELLVRILGHMTQVILSVCVCVCVFVYIYIYMCVWTMSVRMLDN